MSPTLWRCPRCGAEVADAAQHVRSAHPPAAGRGRSADRFGLTSVLGPPSEAPGTGSGESPAPDAVRGPSSAPFRRGRGRPKRLAGDREELDDQRPGAQDLPAEVDAGVLRLEVSNLEGKDALELRFALMRLPHVEAVWIDLSGGFVDLALGPGAHLRHLVNLARSRASLRMTGAELHRLPSEGSSLGDETLLGRLE